MWDPSSFDGLLDSAEAPVKQPTFLQESKRSDQLPPAAQTSYIKVRS